MRDGVYLMADLEFPVRARPRWLRQLVGQADEKHLLVRGVPDSDLDSELETDGMTVRELLDLFEARSAAGQEMIDVSAPARRRVVQLRGYLSGLDALQELLAPLLSAFANAAAVGASGDAVVLGDGVGTDCLYRVTIADGSATARELDSESPAGDELAQRWPDPLFEEIWERYTQWQPESLPAATANRCCFIDAHGATVIPPRFAGARGFRDGLAAVREAEAGNWGYIDVSGAWQIQPAFEEAFAHFDGRALVRVGSCWAFIDGSGEPVIGGLAYGHHFSEGRALVSKDGSNYYFVDSDGVQRGGTYLSAGPHTEGLAPVFIDGLWGYVDEDAAEAILPRFGRAGPFVSGRALVREDGSAKVIDRDGEVLIHDAPIIEANGEGFTVFGNGKLGLIDGDGETIAPMEQDELGELRQGWVNARRGDSWFYHKRGEKPLGPFRAAAPFGCGSAITLGDQWQLIDETGAQTALIEIALDQNATAGRIEANGLAWIKQRGLYGFINGDGQCVVEPVYAAIEDYEMPLIVARYPGS